MVSPKRVSTWWIENAPGFALYTLYSLYNLRCNAPRSQPIEVGEGKHDLNDVLKVFVTVKMTSCRSFWLEDRQSLGASSAMRRSWG